MNPKKIATISAVALVMFVFCLISTIFALISFGLFHVLGDAFIATGCFYLALVTGSVAFLSLVTTVIANAILISLRF